MRLRVNDYVRFNHHVRPRYLLGESGTVIGIDERAVIVRLLRPVGRFESGKVRCPHRMLDRADDARYFSAA